MSASKKPHMNLVVVGHVDNGKSTIVGHMMVDLGVIEQRTIEAFAKESEATGKGDTFKYAWVLDSIKDERDRGITIDLAFQKFETQKYFYTLIDAPGHRDFIKNMITGASEADVAILVVSLKPGETEAATEPGGQAREHAFLARTLGVGQMVVALNKMDDVGYAEARYKEVKEIVEKMLKLVGYNTSKINFVPVSSKDRFNALQSGEIDVLLRDTTWTSTRDTSLGLTFTGVNFYDHQAFMVRKLQVKSSVDLNNVAVSVLDDTTTKLNLADFASTRKLVFKILAFTTSDQAIAAYDSKRCDAYAADHSGLLAAAHKLTEPDLNTILNDVVAKEPLGPAVRRGDETWFQIVRWVHFAMLLAEEAGVTSANVDDQLKSEIPATKRLLGVEGNQGEALGLTNDWAYRIIKLVGNYGEVFERDVGQSSPLKLPRGYNALWSNG